MSKELDLTGIEKKVRVTSEPRTTIVFARLPRVFCFAGESGFATFCQVCWGRFDPSPGGVQGGKVDKKRLHLTYTL